MSNFTKKHNNLSKNLLLNNKSMLDQNYPLISNNQSKKQKSCNDKVVKYGCLQLTSQKNPILYPVLQSKNSNVLNNIHDYRRKSAMNFSLEGEAIMNSKLIEKSTRINYKRNSIDVSFPLKQVINQKISQRKETKRDSLVPKELNNSNNLIISSSSNMLSLNLLKNSKASKQITSFNKENMDVLDLPLKNSHRLKTYEPLNIPQKGEFSKNFNTIQSSRSRKGLSKPSFSKKCVSLEENDIKTIIPWNVSQKPTALKPYPILLADIKQVGDNQEESELCESDSSHRLKARVDSSESSHLPNETQSQYRRLYSHRNKTGNFKHGQEKNTPETFDTQISEKVRVCMINPENKDSFIGFDQSRSSEIQQNPVNEKIEEELLMDNSLIKNNNERLIKQNSIKVVPLNKIQGMNVIYETGKDSQNKTQDNNNNNNNINKPRRNRLMRGCRNSSENVDTLNKISCTEFPFEAEYPSEELINSSAITQTKNDQIILGSSQFGQDFSYCDESIIKKHSISISYRDSFYDNQQYESSCSNAGIDLEKSIDCLPWSNFKASNENKNFNSDKILSIVNKKIASLITLPPNKIESGSIQSRHKPCQSLSSSFSVSSNMAFGNLESKQKYSKKEKIVKDLVNRSSSCVDQSLEIYPRKLTEENPQFFSDSCEIEKHEKHQTPSIHQYQRNTDLVDCSSFRDNTYGSNIKFKSRIIDDNISSNKRIQSSNKKNVISAILNHNLNSYNNPYMIQNSSLFESKSSDICVSKFNSDFNSANEDDWTSTNQLTKIFNELDAFQTVEILSRLRQKNSIKSVEQKMNEKIKKAKDNSYELINRESPKKIS